MYSAKWHNRISCFSTDFNPRCSGSILLIFLHATISDNPLISVALPQSLLLLIFPAVTIIFNASLLRIGSEKEILGKQPGNNPETKYWRDFTKARPVNEYVQSLSEHHREDHNDKII